MLIPQQQTKNTTVKKFDVHNHCWTTSKVLTKKWTYAIKNAFVFYGNKQSKVFRWQDIDIGLMIHVIVEVFGFKTNTK